MPARNEDLVDRFVAEDRAARAKDRAEAERIALLDEALTDRAKMMAAHTLEDEAERERGRRERENAELARREAEREREYLEREAADAARRQNALDDPRIFQQ